jgi:hypothetical protein
MKSLARLTRRVEILEKRPEFQPRPSPRDKARFRALVRMAPASLLMCRDIAYAREQGFIGPLTEAEALSWQELLENLRVELRKAGLEIPPDCAAESPSWVSPEAA